MWKYAYLMRKLMQINHIIESLSKRVLRQYIILTYCFYVNITHLHKLKRNKRIMLNQIEWNQMNFKHKKCIYCN